MQRAVAYAGGRRLTRAAAAAAAVADAAAADAVSTTVSTEALSAVSATAAVADIEDLAPSSKRRRRSGPSKSSASTVVHIKADPEALETSTPIVTGDRPGPRRRRGQDVVANHGEEGPSPSAPVKPDLADQKVPIAKRKLDAGDGVAFVPPADWREVYDGIKTFRASHVAPVDSVGCGSLGDRSQAPPVFRYQTLVALQLSSQTKDALTAAAIARLRANLAGGLTAAAVAAAPHAQLETLLRGVSFHSRKADYLARAAAICCDRYAGDIPPNLEGLLELPGVGPKMAHLAMQSAWQTTTGIGVDTHVHRISRRLGWARPRRLEDPEETRKQLESWLPVDRWAEINELLVGFGQTWCSAVAPKCSECPVKDRCPRIGVAKRHLKKQPEN
ncbi:DNA N-glycosylase and apurinic/apyrimidinic (AP) lyase [Cladochytrium tenue]|nr:DNA N-glycosylase and apurinic/apyrimidinic (AP) lyase [Cladochytrium tenue]